jgi:lipopolysaccharide export system permease protein
MRTLTGYVSRLFLVHVAVMLFSFVALLQLIDLLNNSDRIVERHGNDVGVLIRYIGYRLPELIAFIVPFAVLLAALLVLSRLAQSAEVLALKAAGVSYYRILLTFLPSALLVAAVHFVIADQLAPVATRAMTEWDASADELNAQTTEEPGTAVWIRDGVTLVRVSSVSRRGALLRGVTLFERDENHDFRARITAQRAVYEDDGWVLYDVERFLPTPGGSGIMRYPEWRWETSLLPTHFSDLAATPASLSAAQLHAFTSKQDVGSHPTYFYETWLNRRLALPMISLIMVLLAAPVAQSLSRQRGVALGMMLGIGMGFLYFIVDGLLQALGESGMLPPVLAAWSPALLFAIVGTASLIRVEGQ